MHRRRLREDGIDGFLHHAGENDIEQAGQGNAEGLDLIIQKLPDGGLKTHRGLFTVFPVTGIDVIFFI
ncbi:hypothetical protein [Chania multitudinisentens]|uniref:hypothetical protein n=1 Tax=Chania multitudinisentens TaxID=1639108 RepID=UPI0012B5EF01|nr:hypothetical protein [Chania multitudinisentens]